MPTIRTQVSALAMLDQRLADIQKEQAGLLAAAEAELEKSDASGGGVANCQAEERFHLAY